MMQRRNFCKLTASAAAALALPAAAQETTATTTDALSDFETYTQDYAQFCGTSADKRVFYILENGRFKKTKLDESAWYVSPNSESGPAMPPDLPVPGGSWNGAPMISPIPGLGGEGPYKPTWESFEQYEVPDWYRDAKFGIWAHWSPQCVPEAGDWYARNMYMQGSAQYKFHREHYGPQSQFGYKDLCPQWTLQNWEPDALIERYKKAGARLFLALASHHDNFDAWGSRHQPWNAVNIGPHRDVVGTWAAAARKQGLRFGVTVHQARNWWWLQAAHDTDKTGTFAGIPYDGCLTAADGKGKWWEGLEPQQLYGPKHPPNALPDTSYVKNFYDRTCDLVDQHNPDLLYLDNRLLPLGWGGMNASCYFYNRNLKTHGGKMESVITTKVVPEHLAKCLVADIERDVTSSIMPYPWQSETCIGGWHYDRSLFEQPGEYGGYMHPRDVIHWLIDTVSKNGNFILNIPGRPDGTIDTKEIAVLDQITAWIEVNGEAIYETRPWKVSGEGPNLRDVRSHQPGNPMNFGVDDIRFTRNKSNTVVYALALGWPTKAIAISSLGTSAAARKVEHVQLLGTEEMLSWKQTADCLLLEPPKTYRPNTDFATVFRIRFA